MSLLLGIDVGTTNWKAVAYETRGTIVSLKKTAAQNQADENGQEYLDANEIWAHLSTIIRQVVDECGKDRIAAVAVTSSAESVVPLDRNLEVKFPIIAWFDTRARQEAEEVVQRIGKSRLFEITGLDPNPIFPLLKILWIKRHHPDVFERTAKWLQLADYVNFRLCGMVATDYTLASRTLAYEIDHNCWSEEILSTMDVPVDKFPEVVESGKIIGKVHRQASIETGLLEGTPVVLGGHDHPCATVPTGVFLGDRILDSSGTAESFLLVSECRGPKDGEYLGQRVCRYLDATRYVLWGGIIASGASVDWGMRHLGSLEDWNIASKVSYETLAEMMERTSPGANGVMYLPHLRGSGPPDWDPRSKGSFLGMKTSHTNLDLMRAIFEGLCFQARVIIEMEESVSGTTAKSLCTVGGGAKLLFWQQIKSDVLGKPIEMPEFEDATAYGAALLGGVGVGIYKDFDEAFEASRHNSRQIVPNTENTKTYDHLFEIYRQANAALVDVNAQLDDMFSG